MTHRVLIAIAFAALVAAFPASGTASEGASAPLPASAEGHWDFLEGTRSEPSTGLLGSGLIDPSRITFRNSVSYGVTSGSGGTHSGGLWLSQLGYRLADPLQVSVELGAAITPGQGDLLAPENVFLHGVNLDYRPSDSFHISIDYRHLPANAASAYWMSRGYAPGRAWGFSGFDRSGPFAPRSADSGQP